MVALMPDAVPTVEGFACVGDERLRAAGMSRQKTAYLRDLCEKISNRTLDLDALAALPDEDVIKALVTVKGIGRWSAEMFLIFRLHRPDVLPVGDLGIVTAVQRVYRLRKKPTPERIRKNRRGVAALSVGGVVVPVAEPRQRASGGIDSRKAHEAGLIGPACPRRSGASIIKGSALCSTSSWDVVQR